MEITDIRIRRIETMGKLKAVVSVTFDDMFVVHDMKIIEGQEGFFVAMPSRRTPSCVSSSGVADAAFALLQVCQEVVELKSTYILSP